MKIHPSNLEATGLRFAVVVARFNHLVGVRLLEACTAELSRRGSDDVEIFWVPGAFEIPLTARQLAVSGRYQAIVTLGAVIRGATPHFDFVCNGLTDGLREVMRDTGVPVAFGVLTTHSVEQAFERAGGAGGNKGSDVAKAAIEMARLSRAVGAAGQGTSG